MGLSLVACSSNEPEEKKIEETKAIEEKEEKEEKINGNSESYIDRFQKRRCLL